MVIKPIVFQTFSLPWHHGNLKSLLSESRSADLLLPMLYVIVFFSLTMTHCQCHFRFWSSENQQEWVCLYESRGPWERNDIDHFKEIVMKHIHMHTMLSKFRGQFNTTLSSVIYNYSCCFQTPKQYLHYDMFEPCNHHISEWSMIVQVNMSWIGLLLLATILNYT